MKRSPLKRSTPLKAVSSLKTNKPINKRGAGARRNDPLDRAWAKAVKVRAGGYCQVCGEFGAHAHHLLSRAAHPKLRHDIANGAFLCPTCHQRAHASMSTFRAMFAAQYAEFRPLWERYCLLDAARIEATNPVSACFGERGEASQ